MHHTHKFQYNPDERLKRQDPNYILAFIGLEQGMRFVDLGANDGFFSIPAAKIVGEAGAVYAIDMDSYALDRLVDRTAKNNLKNIKVFAQTAEASPPCNDWADILFIGTALHDFLDPVKSLENARKMIKPSGRIYNLDWKKQDSAIGPPKDIRFSESLVIELANTAGLQASLRPEFSGDDYYLIEMQK